MPLRSDKKTLQGDVQPWRCDVCGEPFEPDLNAICSSCGGFCCPGHRAMRAEVRRPGGLAPVCARCEAVPRDG